MQNRNALQRHCCILKTFTPQFTESTAWSSSHFHVVNADVIYIKTDLFKSMRCCVYNLFLCLMEHNEQSGIEHSAKQGNPEVNKILRGEGESSYQRIENLFSIIKFRCLYLFLQGIHKALVTSRCLAVPGAEKVEASGFRSHCIQFIHTFQVLKRRSHYHYEYTWPLSI